MQVKKIKSVAFYLPQYHPIPENDRFWGKGFTEWINVTKAKPLFEGHYQPHIPADLGFYDLRLEEVRLAQEELARKYSIDAFCYYHYWFNGKRVLNKPLDLKLKNSKESLPFMICWANEHWTRRWDGLENEILIEQKYSLLDDELHINELLQYLLDPRYLEYKGKKIIAIYKPQDLPNPESTLRVWKNKAKENGIELFICRIETFNNSDYLYFNDVFDAAIEFQPFTIELQVFQNEQFKKSIKNNFKLKLLLKIFKILSLKSLYKKILDDHLRSFWNDNDYCEFVNFMIGSSKAYSNSNKTFPCVTPFWDNTPRRGINSFRFINPNPKKFGEWVKKVMTNLRLADEENLIFINAWNEWAEGNHLEPCQKFGHSYLIEFKAGMDNK